MTRVRRRLLIGGLIGGMAAVGFAAATAFTSAAPGRIDPRDAGQVALGEEVYAAECAACHGDEMEGAPDWRSPQPGGRYPAPPHDETGHTWHHADAALFDYVKLGGAEALARSGVEGFESEMPGFGDVLRDDEIRAVLAYIKASWPEHIREAQEARDALARQ